MASTEPQDAISGEVFSGLSNMNINGIIMMLEPLNMPAAATDVGSWLKRLPVPEAFACAQSRPRIRPGLRCWR